MPAECRLEQVCGCGSKKRQTSAPAIELNYTSGRSGGTVTHPRSEAPYAKTSEPGTWDGPKALDWTVIGNVADQVRIMTYEYHWSTSDAGAPVDWVDQVLSFARSVIPAHKIMEGVPLYGYDWTGRSGTPIIFEEAMALSAQRGAPVNWDTSSASPRLEYVAQQERHAVWFENAASVDAKPRARRIP